MIVSTHFKSAKDAREFIFAAAGLATGRAALEAIGQDPDRFAEPSGIKALADTDVMRIAEELRYEMGIRFPGLFPSVRR